MGNEAAALPIQGLATRQYTVATAKTEQTIVSTIEQLFSTGIERLAVVTIRLSYAKEAIDAPYAGMLAEKSTLSFLDDLRPLVRKTDRVLLLGHSMYFLLLGATLQGGQIVQSRLWEAVLWRIHTLHSEHDNLYPQIITIGHSSCSLAEETIPACITAADVAQCCFDAQPEDTARMHDVEVLDQQVKNSVDEELPELARSLGIPYLHLLPRKVPQSLQRLVTPKLAHELWCYPLGRERNMLTVAMLNPADSSALDRLKQETGLSIFPVLAHPQALQVALEKLVEA